MRRGSPSRACLNLNGLAAQCIPVHIFVTGGMKKGAVARPFHNVCGRTAVYLIALSVIAVV